MKENHRKCIAVSWLLAIMMLITCIPATAFADSTSGWNGEPAAEAPAVSESGGISWYQIEDAADLAWFAKEINDGTTGAAGSDANAVLTSDIDLNGQNWTAIGTTDNPFKGKFDGKGHSISNLCIDTSSQYQGLFGDSYGTVSNVDIKSGKVTSTATNTGSLMGMNNAGGIVENCSSAAVVTDNSASTSYFGGLVGNNSGTVTKSSFTGTVQTGNETVKQKNFGGIAGYMSDADATIKGCMNAGIIKAYESVETGNCVERIAGIVGNADKGSVYHCYNKGSISVNSGIKNACTAGIAARIGNGGRVFNCLNTGKASTSYGYDGTTARNGQIYSKSGSHKSAVSSNNYYLESDIVKGDEAGVTAVAAADINSDETIANLNKANSYDITVESDILFKKGSGTPTLQWETSSEPEPVAVTAVTVSGDAITGSKLQAKATGADGADATNVTYQWQASTDKDSYTDIKDATDPSFAIPDTTEYVGKTIRVKASGESDSSAVSDATTAIVKSDALKVAEAKEALKLTQDEKITEALKIDLPAKGSNGTDITWSSSNTSVISADGQVTLPDKGIAKVTLTATVTSGEKTDTKEFPFNVWSSDASSDLGTLDELAEKYEYGASSPKSPADTNLITYMESDFAKKGFEGVTAAIDKVTADREDYNAYAGIAKDGTITHLYYDLNKLSDMFYTRTTSYTVDFTLKKGDAEKKLSRRVVLTWDTVKVSRQMKDEVIDLTTEDLIKGDNTSLDDVTSKMELPSKINGKTWCEVVWTSSDSDVLKVTAPAVTDGSTPYTAEPLRGIEDQKVTLTATYKFRQSGGDATVEKETQQTKTFEVTVKSIGDELRSKMQKALDENYTIDKLTYFGTDKAIDPENITDDIQFLRPAKTGIEDYNNYKFTVTSKDKDSLKVNAYKGNIYRPLPGESAKEVTFTVTMKHQNYDIAVTKDFTVKLAPLVQSDIDKEVSLMEAAKASYFDGIKGGNTDKDSITEDMHAFQEVHFADDGKTLVWIHDSADRTDHGIVPADIDGYDPMGSALWRTFRSSTPSVIAHENLLYHKPEYDTKVTVDSCLTSETYARYAEKYPDNETFQKLSRQPVSVTVTVKGEKSGEKPAPEKFSVSFAMMGDTAHKEGEHKAYIQWIAAETSTVEEGTSVMELTKTVLDKNGFKYTGASNYISSVTSPDGTTLSGTGNGPNSGWMYRVNGKDAEVSADNYILKKGDTVLWYYTDDYEKEYVISAESVSISKTSAKLTCGRILKLTAEVSPAYADDSTVTWTSSDDSIATVSKDGKVKALKAGNVTITASTGDKSASCSIKVAPASPAKFKAISAGTTSVKLTWGKAAGADKYKVYRATSAKGTYKLVKTTSALYTTDKKLTTGKNYYYKVRALGGKNFYSSYSAVAKAKPVPAKVTLKAKAGKRSATLSWTKVSGASGYKVYRATKKNGSYKRICTTTKTKFVNKSLKKGKTYYYKVRAYKTVKGTKICGAYSAVKTVRAK